MVRAMVCDIHGEELAQPVINPKPHSKILLLTSLMGQKRSSHSAMGGREICGNGKIFTEQFRDSEAGQLQKKVGRDGGSETMDQRRTGQGRKKFWVSV